MYQAKTELSQYFCESSKATINSLIDAKAKDAFCYHHSRISMFIVKLFILTVIASLRGRFSSTCSEILDLGVNFGLCVSQGACCPPTGRCWWHAVMSWRRCSAESMQRRGAGWCPSTESPQIPSSRSWSTSTLTPAVLVSSLHTAQVCARLRPCHRHCCWIQ